MFNRLNRYNLRFNSNNQKNNQTDELTVGIFSGIIGIMFGGSLYFDIKKEYSKDEKFCRNMILGVSVGSIVHSAYYITKYLKK
jgi:hypothetical protein